MKICAFLTMLTLISIASAFLGDRCHRPAYPDKYNGRLQLRKYFTFVSGACYSYRATAFRRSRNQFKNRDDCEIECVQDDSDSGYDKENYFRHKQRRTRHH